MVEESLVQFEDEWIYDNIDQVGTWWDEKIFLNMNNDNYVSDG